MGILQARRLECVAISSPGDLPNPEIESRSRALQADSLLSEPPGKPKNTGVGNLSMLQVVFLTQELNQVSCIAGGFFTSYQGSSVVTETATIQRIGLKEIETDQLWN